MDGLILIDKPKDWTSHDVVAKLRGLLKKSAGHKVKIGHTGTLDPLATGLLVLCVGSYCKRAQEFSKLDKIYEVTMCLGQTSTTGDEEGKKTNISIHQPSLAEFNHTIEQFVGTIEQVPPIYSAIKVNGKRAYQMAREGKEVKLEPRQVAIYSISNVQYAYPTATFACHVSSGTYIRSLVEDIGKVLKTGAYMSDLCRTQVGNFKLINANQIPDLVPELVHDIILTK